jgi:hypothetical protein
LDATATTVLDPVDVDAELVPAEEVISTSQTKKRKRGANKVKKKKKGR